MPLPQEPFRLSRRSLLSRGSVAAGSALLLPIRRHLFAQMPNAAGVQYYSGYNLITILPGMVFPSSVTATFDAYANGAYTAVDVSAVKPDQTGWLFTDTALTTQVGSGSNSPISLQNPAGQWSLLGNPSSSFPARISGADAAYVFDGASQTYQATTTIPIGQAAWVFTQAARTVVASPANPAVSSPDTGANIPSQLDQANRDAKIVVSSKQDVSKYFEPITQAQAKVLEQQSLGPNALSANLA